MNKTVQNSSAQKRPFLFSKECRTGTFLACRVALLVNWHTSLRPLPTGFDHRVLLCSTGTEWMEPSAMMYAEAFKWVLEDRPYVGCEFHSEFRLSLRVQAPHLLRVPAPSRVTQLLRRLGHRLPHVHIVTTYDSILDERERESELASNVRTVF